MIINPISRASLAVVAVALLSVRAVAQGEAELAGAFGSMGTSLAVMAQFKTQSQRPVAANPSPTDSDWDKTLARVLREGKCETDAGTSLATCQLEEVIGDPKDEHTAYSISLTGRVGANGAFETTGGRMTSVRLSFQPDLRRVVIRDIKTGAGGVLVSYAFKDTLYWNSGLTKVVADDVYGSGDGEADSAYRRALTHWALAPLETPSQAGRPVSAAPKASDTFWDKALYLVLNKGKCATEPSTLVITCELEDHTGDPKYQHEIFRIRVTGLAAADGTFKLTEALLIHTRMTIGRAEGIAEHKTVVECGIDGAGKPANITETRSNLMLDGTTIIRSSGSGMRVAGTVSLGHWATRR